MSVYIPVTSAKRQDCEAIHKLYTRVKRLGNGASLEVGDQRAYGTAYQACKKGTTDCNYVLKVMTFDSEIYEMSGSSTNTIEVLFREWDNEVEVFTALNEMQDRSKIKISPILYDAWYCIEEENAYFYILMEKYDGDLKSLLKKVGYSVVKNLCLRYMDLALAFIHFRCRICLNDIKLENILYKQIGDNDYELVFSDFGEATLYSDDECIEEDRARFKRMIDYELSK
jgi:serine/threonine protein kinase